MAYSFKGFSPRSAAPLLLGLWQGQNIMVEGCG